jgi:hypothetical protein
MRIQAPQCTGAVWTCAAACHTLLLPPPPACTAVCQCTASIHVQSQQLAAAPPCISSSTWHTSSCTCSGRHLLLLHRPAASPWLQPPGAAQHSAGSLAGCSPARTLAWHHSTAQHSTARHRYHSIIISKWPWQTHNVTGVHAAGRCEMSEIAAMRTACARLPWSDLREAGAGDCPDDPGSP